MNEASIIPYSCVRRLIEGAALVLAPHPDDEILGCGGAVLRHVDAGDPVTVVIFTDGAAASGAADHAGDYVAMRQAESRAAAQVLGYGAPHFLDYPDRGLVYDEDLVARVASLIAIHRPAIVYAPSIYEVHPDHRALAFAAIEAVRRRGGALAVACYEIGNPQLPNRLLDVTDLTDTLKAAMRCFPSQLAERPYDSYVLDGLNRFRAYTLGPGVDAAEAYWMATGEELRARPPGLYRALMGAWADAGVPPNMAAPAATIAPLVSIVTRTIGRPSLAETLDSICAQTYPRIEIVLVEADPAQAGRSGEGCWRYPLRTVGGTAPLDRSVAANLGLAHARGEMILLLDDDDYIDPDHVATLVALLRGAEDAVAAYSGVRVVASREPGQPPVAVFHEPFDADRLAYDNYLPVHGVLFRRRALDAGCRFDESLVLYEDWDFWLQVSRHGRFLRSDGVTATYVSTGGSGAGTGAFDPAVAQAARLAVYRKWLGLWQPEDINRVLGLHRNTEHRLHQAQAENGMLRGEAATLHSRIAALEAELARAAAAPPGTTAVPPEAQPTDAQTAEVQPVCDAPPLPSQEEGEEPAVADASTEQPETQETAGTPPAEPAQPTDEAGIDHHGPDGALELERQASSEADAPSPDAPADTGPGDAVATPAFATETAEHTSEAGADGPPDLSAFKALPFPLNVYGALLQIEVGEVAWLHFALFDHPGEPMVTAQRRSTDLLLAQLPPPPARILEVGTGLGTLLAELVAKGYDVTGINPDPAQVAVAQARFGADLPLVEATYEGWTPPPDAEPFDVILFQESAQYIDTLTLFDRALDLLRPDGRIILLDEFAIRRTSWSPEPLHLHDHVVALADRLGFSVERDEDLSAKAAHTVDKMLEMTSRHHTTLEESLEVPAELIAKLDASNAAYRAAYAEGRFGYRLLVLRRDRETPWRLRAITNAHHDAFAALFRETFGHDMPLATWEWKYGEGRGHGIGVWIDGQLSAHYGHCSRPALVFGHPSRLGLPGDVMARKKSHRTLGRRGPFFAAAATLQEVHGGFGTDHLVGAGFPNARANRGPRLLGLYSDATDRVVELHWPLGDTDAAPDSRRVDDPDDAEARREIDALWQLMAQDLSAHVVAIRNFDILVQRYLRHPEKTYEIHLIRDGGVPLGVAVLSRTGPDSFELMDLVGPLDAMNRLLQAARSIAAAGGAQDLWGWFAEACVAGRIATPDCEVRDISVETPTFIWRPGIPPEDLIGRIWLTSGDTDFH
ncbi:PIG-L family deacetylase [Xanthobacter sp. 126]|uniref:PIG-L family deacetylase n=1 Tax=Xanthobacter sp. 126 TaxID=1131814 RepID=UPI0004BA239D|nr:PIG-L family deacetylase [Xanthobacter sp. 126]